MSTIGYLHTSPVHIGTFDALMRWRSPLLGTVHAVDEALLAQAQAQGPAATRSRVRALVRQLVDSGADIVCCTCSSIGDIAETVDAGAPVFRVDRPMARRAVATGPRIGVLAVLDSTLAPTRELLAQEALAAGTETTVDLVVADGAWALFEAGDLDGYARVIAEAARTMGGRHDVIVLAQASMAPAAELLADLSVAVLSSPRLAVEHAAALVARMS